MWRVFQASVSRVDQAKLQVPLNQGKCFVVRIFTVLIPFDFSKLGNVPSCQFDCSLLLPPFSSLALFLLDFPHFVTKEVRVREGRRKKQVRRHQKIQAAHENKKQVRFSCLTLGNKRYMRYFRIPFSRSFAKEWSLLGSLSCLQLCAGVSNALGHQNGSRHPGLGSKIILIVSISVGQTRSFLTCMEFSRFKKIPSA